MHQHHVGPSYQIHLGWWQSYSGPSCFNGRLRERSRNMLNKLSNVFDTQFSNSGQGSNWKCFVLVRITATQGPCRLWLQLLARSGPKNGEETIQFNINQHMTSSNVIHRHQSSKKSKQIQQSTCAALDRLGYLQLSPQSYKRDSTEDVGSKSPKCPCVRLAPNIACQRLKGQHWHGKWGRRANVLIKLCQNPAHLQDFCNATTSNAEFYKPHAQHSS